MTIIAFPSVSRGAGQSSLVFHLAWMYADLGLSVVVADFDPQAGLTSKFLDTGQLDALWSGEKATRKTVYGSLRPLLDGSGGFRPPQTVEISPGIDLLPGDPALAEAEPELARQWVQRLAPGASALRTLEGIRRMLEQSATEIAASLVLLDVGPNLGALNRAVLMTAENAVVPLATDVNSPHGLRSFGRTLWSWRREWEEFVRRGSGTGTGNSCLSAEAVRMAGYVVLDRAFFLNRPLDAPDRWAQRLAMEYQNAVLRDLGTLGQTLTGGSQPLARLKHYTGLLPMAREARKPIFFLQAADGVIGSEVAAIQDCYFEFRDAARRIAESCSLLLP